MKKNSLLASFLLIGAVLLCCGGHVLAALGGLSVLSGLASGKTAFLVAGGVILALGIALRGAAKKRDAVSTSDSSCCDSRMKNR